MHERLIEMRLGGMATGQIVGMLEGDLQYRRLVLQNPDKDGSALDLYLDQHRADFYAALREAGILLVTGAQGAPGTYVVQVGPETNLEGVNKAVGLKFKLEKF